MPPKKRSLKKSSNQQGDTWLEKLFHKQDILLALMEVLGEHQITEAVLAGITKQDLANMHLMVGHKIILYQVIASLQLSTPELMTGAVSNVVSSTLPEITLSNHPFKLEDELAKIEAEFCKSKTTIPIL